ncbi:MAG: hypothetical protein JWO82_3174, partial [Akkermansiaceae bacterium]|nr:hypothetical protein [Akkermansiaceae bacterium]
MSRKQVVILWVIAVILAASAIVVKTRSAKGFDSHTARARGQTLFADFPVKEVARVKITSGKETVTLARKGEDWVVADRADYPANVANLSEFLRLVAQVKVVEGVES